MQLGALVIQIRLDLDAICNSVAICINRKTSISKGNNRKSQAHTSDVSGFSPASVVDKEDDVSWCRMHFNKTLIRQHSSGSSRQAFTPQHQAGVAAMVYVCVVGVA